MTRGLILLFGFVFALALLDPGRAHAASKKVLFVSLVGYTSDGARAFDEVELEAGPANATYVLLSGAGGQAVAALAADTYEQVWFYDLSTAPDAFPADYEAIRVWYESAPIKEVICDGRFLSSFWSGRYATEGRLLVQNYYRNLNARGGGIVIGTDHDSYSTQGANVLAAALGLGGFSGNFGGAFPLDAGHPLTTTPNVLASLSNDSSTGQAPFGVQPGGRVLHTIGYHTGNPLTPGISTTIDGGVLGITVDITTAAGPVCGAQLVLEVSVTTGSEFGPFSYAWSIDGAAIGTTNPLTVATSALTAGPHSVRVLVTGAGGRADEDLIDVVIADPVCTCGVGALDLCDEGGAVFVLPVVGPVGGQYVVCRIVPVGYGAPAATSTQFRCDDADADGVVDLYSAAAVASAFGAGFCGMP